MFEWDFYTIDSTVNSILWIENIKRTTNESQTRVNETP